MIQGWKGQGKLQRLEQYIGNAEVWNQPLKGWVIDSKPASDESLEICYNLEEDAKSQIKYQYLTGPQKIIYLCLVKNFTFNF